MNRKNGRFLRAGLALLPTVSFAAGAAAGPILLAGDGAEGHASASVYGDLLEVVVDNVSNGQRDILAIGVDFPSPAADFILEVVNQMSMSPKGLMNPPSVAFINDETILVFGFSGYGVLYIPSDSDSIAGTGGISAEENGFLSARADDIADFLNNGGGLFGLTQGTLPDAYDYLLGVSPIVSVGIPPSGECAAGVQYDDVSPTPTGEVVGITETNLDGCCWHSAYSVFPENLSVLATVDQPGCPDIDGQAAVLLGFVTIEFQEPVVTPAAGVPNVEAAGDLDGDDTPDVIAVLPGDDVSMPGNVQLFFNQGNDEDGVWQGLMEGPVLEVQLDPQGVAVGLFNGDQALDFAVTNAGSNSVSVFINEGGGTFMPPTRVENVGNRPIAIIAEDFGEDLNNDTDLAVTLADDDAVVLLFGDGNGGFGGGGPEVGFPLFGAGSNPFAMTSGDFDNNKCDDAAGTNNTGSALGPAGGTVFVLLDQGGGNFAPAAFYDVGNFPVDLTVADFDGDNFPDIAAVNFGDGTVSVLINNQDGTFAPQITLPVGSDPISVVASELSNDGKPDIALVSNDPQLGPALQTLQNQTPTLAGNGVSFGAPIGHSVVDDPNFVLSTDLNLDSASDVVTVNSVVGARTGGPGGSVTALLGNPSPVEEPTVVFLDIKPGKCPNPFNPGSMGVLPVALVGTQFFDVTEVDVQSLQMRRADGVGGSVPPIQDDDDDDDDDGPTVEDVATPFEGVLCDCHSLAGDGIPDLKMRFETEDVAKKLELQGEPGGESIELVVSGTLLDGTPFGASDCIVIVPPTTAPGLLSVGSNAAGVFIDITPMDQQVDGSGRTPFERSYQQGTTVRLSAPAWHNGFPFLGWNVDGFGPLQPATTINLTVFGEQQSATAIYLIRIEAGRLPRRQQQK